MRRTVRRGLIAGALAMTIGVALWWSGPHLLAPREDFPQGPGGAVAYISLARQLRDQWTYVRSGGEIHLVMTEPEFSGMLSSVLLSGQGEERVIRKVRGRLEGAEIRVDAILESHDPRLPEHYRGPVGLTLHLDPTVSGGGEIRFQIKQAAAGRIPLPVPLLRWSGRWLPVPGFDAQQVALTLPVTSLIEGQLGRQIDVTQFATKGGKLYLAADIAPPK